MIFQSSALIGLSVIIIAWIIQLAYSWKGNREMKKRFLIIYAIGIALLVIDGYINDTKDVAIFNLISLILVMALLIRLSPKRSGSVTKARPVKRRRR